jgi:serine/threonine protein kinase
MSFAMSEMKIGPEVYGYGFYYIKKEKIPFIAMEKYEYSFGSKKFLESSVENIVKGFMLAAQKLDLLHEIGLAHNDVKNTNIMFNTDTNGDISEVTLIDFGFTQPFGTVFMQFGHGYYFPLEIESKLPTDKLSSKYIDSYQLVFHFIFSLRKGRFPVSLNVDFETYVQSCKNFYKDLTDNTNVDNIKESRTFSGSKLLDLKELKMKFAIFTIHQLAIRNVCLVKDDSVDVEPGEYDMQVDEPEKDRVVAYKRDEMNFIYSMFRSLYRELKG